MRFYHIVGLILFTKVAIGQVTTQTPSLTITGDSTGVNTNDNLTESVQYNLPPELQSIQDQLKTDSLSQQDAERLLNQAEDQIPSEYKNWLDSLKSAYNMKIDSTTTDKAVETGTKLGMNKLKQVDGK